MATDVEVARLPNGRFPSNGDGAADRTPHPVELTVEQRTEMVALIKAEHDAGRSVGNEQALRRIGVTGRKTDLRASIDDELRDLCREARGWNLTAVKAAAWKVATDTSHSHWDRANARILKAYGGARFRDDAKLELSGGLDVRTDVAEAIDRFTTLADAAVRALARTGAGAVVVDVDGRREGESRLQLEGMAGEAEPA